MSNKELPLSLVLKDFDYRVGCDDFILYEAGRLIEEDRASFDDEEFRGIIDEGIHVHVEAQLEIRAEIAKRLRQAPMDKETRVIAAKVVRAVEDIDCPLNAVGTILESYTAYIFRRLQDCADEMNDRAGPVADLLFDSLDNRAVVEKSLETLESLRSDVSARVLAHIVSEPMLDEDLEQRAYNVLRSMWPLSRHYILYSLKPHDHEDIPFRWFQLLIECKDTDAVDRILDEMLIHGDDSEFREDLVALVELLGQSSDPGRDQKIIEVLNGSETPEWVSHILGQFLKTSPSLSPKVSDSAPWTELARLRTANKSYLAATKLFDAGRIAEAVQKLDEVLIVKPEYPFAVTLKTLMERGFRE